MFDVLFKLYSCPIYVFLVVEFCEVKLPFITEIFHQPSKKLTERNSSPQWVELQIIWTVCSRYHVAPFTLTKSNIHHRR